MIIPQSNTTVHFSRPSFYKAPVLRFELPGEDALTKKIECITARSFKGLNRHFAKKDYTTLTLTRKNDPKSFFKSRNVQILVKNKDLKKLIGKEEFKRLQIIESSSKRFSQLKKCVGPLNPLDARKIQKGSSSSEWQALSLQINSKLKDLFPKIESTDIKKVRRAINKMIVSKNASIFGLVDVNIEGKTQQIFLKKHKGKILIDQAKYCGEGGNATVYKVAGYALKKFNIAEAIASAEARNENPADLEGIGNDLKKEVEEEIQASKDVSGISGTLKISAKLKDMKSGRLIGYVMKAYDGDFGDYLLSSLDLPNRPIRLCNHFAKIAHTFSEMHKTDKVHTDIKIDNIFTNFDLNGVSELVVGDITKTDPDNTTFSYSLPYSFQPEVNQLKFDDKRTLEERLELQKKLDVRQFAFFMYYSIRAEKSENKKVEGKVKLNYAFPPSDPSRKVSSPKDFPTKEERVANYTPIPDDKAPRAIRDFIEYLLTEDFEKLLSMEAVHQELQEIYSIQSNKLLR